MAEAEIEPDRFDLIVLGTGLPESILAAAAASSGRKVLHLDSNGHYGSEWASLPLDHFTSYITSLGDCNGTPSPSSSSSRNNNTENLTDLGLIPAELRPDEFIYSHGEIRELEASQLGSSRGYNLDLASPKLLFCAEPMVDLLVRCGGSNYLEFKDVRATFVWDGSGFSSSPTSSSELFQDRSLAERDKLRLMRFLRSVQAFASGAAGFSGESLKISFAEFLQRERLPATIQSKILYAVALLEEDQQTCNAPLSAAGGLEILKLHMSSIERFETSGAFLCTMYGQAEIAQAFCRVAAVNGTLYVLRRPVASVILDKETREYRGVRTKSGQIIYSEKLVLGASYHSFSGNQRLSSGDSDAENSLPVLGRCVCITDDSLHLAYGNLLVIFPPRTLNVINANVVRVMQFGNTAVSPEGKYVVHISSVAENASAAKATLQAVMNTLFYIPGSDGDVTSLLQPETCKPKLLWSTFYVENLQNTISKVIGDRVGVCAQPGSAPDFRDVFASTEKMFHQLFGSEEWFPRPNTLDLEAGDVAQWNEPPRTADEPTAV